MNICGRTIAYVRKHCQQGEPMKTSKQWLEAAKTVLRIDSDRALARHFGWSQGTIGAYANGRLGLSNTHAAQIAEVLQVNPLVIIADAETERAKDEPARLFWANAAKKFAGIVASVLLVSTLMALDANPAYSATIEGEHFILC